ncbi:MAG: bifunctional phosphoribosylaminoimidazolecarboxamide formyltransferase/IMP cyclohydrolase [Flavobacteriaceae bacterium]
MSDIADPIAIRRALISVSDKTGLADFARRLAAAGAEILSTGGTAKALREAGIAVTDVSEVTKFPEIMDGRVKTLHPGVHGGLLADRARPAHMEAIESLGIGPIDLLAVNLYPFEETVARGADFGTTVENIDIGGPAMIRAAAKNHSGVAVIVDPADYNAVAGEAEKGGVSAATRRALAAKAFARTASYDAAIAQWLNGEAGITEPEWFAAGGRLAQILRYGENPHQRAAFYVGGPRREGVSTARVVQGKELSYNNINDTDAAFELVAEFAPADSAAIAIIKHANPCGVAVGATLLEAYERAYACDTVSAFGGIVAANRPLDAAAAEAITRIFTEVVIAPGADDEALSIFAAKKNLRLLLTGGLPDPTSPGLALRNVAGGLLVQSRDSGTLAGLDLKVVTRRQPSERERADMLFAWKVAKHVKSNAIVYARDGATVGVGAGQMSRVDSARIAARKAEDAAAVAGGEPLTRGSAVASDAFFPFADGLLATVEAGATAVIQPGGSMRDDEVIAAADDTGIAMIFTGMRHFRH